MQFSYNIKLEENDLKQLFLVLVLGSFYGKVVIHFYWFLKIISMAIITLVLELFSLFSSKLKVEIIISLFWNFIHLCNFDTKFSTIIFDSWRNNVNPRIQLDLIISRMTDLGRLEIVLCKKYSQSRRRPVPVRPKVGRKY